MMKLFLSLMLMVALCSSAEGNETFTQANLSYESGKFAQAAEGYEALLKDEGPRVSVLNNLGSAYFRLGDHARAILAFERALILSPGDPDLSANLKLAQEQAAVFPEQASNGWRGFLAGVSPNTLAMIALIAAVLLPLTAIARIRFRSGARWAVVLLLLNLVVLRVALRPIKDQVDPGSRGVVLATPATVRLSPFETAESRGTLSSGREVTLGQFESGHYWVDTNGGATKGWVHEDEVARIVPAILDLER